MKAWCVTDRWEMEFGIEIVFAETRGQAITIAMGLDNFMDSCFLDLKAKRAPNYDQYYKPDKRYIDWDNDEDRIVLASNGCYCHPDSISPVDDCPSCCASNVCSYYQDYLEDCYEDYLEQCKKDAREC